ncbi:ribosomal protein L21 [Thermodesulfobium narugense DSM 14796]|uniref:50S ribosomal protein L21 n=1 Tax=Thermodesulfobium narugense DSM 14796 TaxID=747365 RepID=M1E8J3_9BACT|nr:50S ribosomal protein L21 [Thermodesulfobium narugense]AEE14980.1 ribosomal protein L21 [Thermodesulfobium narugense DSM 14796]
MVYVLKIRGKEFLAAPGDKIKVPFIEGLSVGEKFVVENALVFDEEPEIRTSNVETLVEGSGKERTVIAFKYRPKKGYRNKKGNRQKFTLLRVSKI